MGEEGKKAEVKRGESEEEGGNRKGKKEKYDQRQRRTSVKKSVCEFTLQLKRKLSKRRQALANKDEMSSAKLFS